MNTFTMGNKKEIQKSVKRISKKLMTKPNK